MTDTETRRTPELDEPVMMNPVRAAFLRETERMAGAGVSVEEASRQACLRVFSSGPGCYGTGLLPLIDAGNWETARDLAFCAHALQGTEDLMVVPDTLARLNA